jgi:hypothetical protein
MVPDYPISLESTTYEKAHIMGQWDNLKSGSVARGLRKGLGDDLILSHAEVVDIIRGTLKGCTKSQIHAGSRRRSIK